MAIDLASDPQKLAVIRLELERNRSTTPLFNTSLYTKHIETAYDAMYERYQAGLSPDHIVVGN
jgi:predicted O-linked N-acetylglucosamine transferase (SPINDLY family)